MRHRVPLIVLVCATLLSSHPALAQFSQQGPKLVGTVAMGNAGQGISVFLSADGRHNPSWISRDSEPLRPVPGTRQPGGWKLQMGIETRSVRN